MAATVARSTTIALIGTSILCIADGVYGVLGGLELPLLGLTLTSSHVGIAMAVVAVTVRIIVRSHESTSMSSHERQAK